MANRIGKHKSRQVVIFDDELPTVLAALRYFQQDLEDNEEPPISEHFHDHPPLTTEEIDSLCERLNT